MSEGVRSVPLSLALRNTPTATPMNQATFFQHITQFSAQVGAQSIPVPVFYQDIMALSAQFLAPIAKIQALLPSPRMHPLRVTPWHGVVNIAAFEYRQCDIGPYNEVAIALPFVLDRPSPLFVGTLSPVPPVLQVFVRHLPVTTQLACDAGIQFANYPKFVADITFKQDSNSIHCQLQGGDRPILSLTAPTGPLQPAPRSRMYPMTRRDGYLLRSEFIAAAHDHYVGKGRDLHLDLGDHPIAQELKTLQLGRAIAYQYTPHYQGSLTSVLESLSL